MKGSVRQGGTMIGSPDTVTWFCCVGLVVLLAYGRACLMGLCKSGDDTRQ